MTKTEEAKKKTRQIYEALPKLDDQKCGYRSCGEFARAVAEGRAPCDGCVTGGPEVTAQVCQIMGVDIPEKSAGESYAAPNIPPTVSPRAMRSGGHLGAARHRGPRGFRRRGRRHGWE